MNDRELLEKAAKAARIKAQYSDNFGDFSIGEPYSKGEVRWNPLTDDGDALRLAVRLKLKVYHGEESAIAEKRFSHQWVGEPYGDDKYAATRRAIVRAAAAMADAGREG